MSYKIIRKCAVIHKNANVVEVAVNKLLEEGCALSGEHHHYSPGGPLLTENYYVHRQEMKCPHNCEVYHVSSELITGEGSFFGECQ